MEETMEKDMEKGGSVKLEKRETWARKIDFLLACIGFSVGLGNVWRFPYLCYKNGGGAFLIPYFISVLLGGIPVFFLEVALGQFMSEGGISSWKICPLFQGIGYASAVIVFLLNCEYNIILTWAFYYLFSSFTDVLPWSHCNNDWNTKYCTTDHRAAATNSTLEFLNSTTGNSTMSYEWGESKAGNLSMMAANLTNNVSKYIEMDPVTEFWELKVLQLSAGVGSPGAVKWDLALCLLLAWIVVYFCIWKGIKTSGKVKRCLLAYVMYFTATSPYILMFGLMVRGVTLEGSAEGIKYYLFPDWSRLTDTQVWVDAGTQIFFSYSISLGTLTALGSYNKFHHNSYRDCALFALMNSFTSLLAGFVIFSVLGFMAHKHGVSVKDVAESGPGLAFIAYPEALAQMPIAPLWSILFFLMLILLGLDSQFVGVEGFITAVADIFPHLLRRSPHKELFIAGVSLVCFLIGLSMVTEGGMYVFQLFDYYSASRIVLVVAFFECIAVSYIYGVDRFSSNLEYMYGFRVGPVIKFMWLVIAPIFTVVIFTMGAISYSELVYDRKTVKYTYPSWAIGLGWLMACSSIVFIPGVMIFKIARTKGTFLQRIRILTKPDFSEVQQRREKCLPDDDPLDENKKALVEMESLALPLPQKPDSQTLLA